MLFNGSFMLFLYNFIQANISFRYILIQLYIIGITMQVYKKTMEH